MTDELKTTCDNFTEILERGDASFAREYLIAHPEGFPLPILNRLLAIEELDFRIPSERRQIEFTLRLIHQAITKGLIR